MSECSLSHGQTCSHLVLLSSTALLRLSRLGMFQRLNHSITGLHIFFFLLSGVSGNAPHHASGNEGQSVARGPDPIFAEGPDRFFCSPSNLGHASSAL